MFVLTENRGWEKKKLHILQEQIGNAWPVLTYNSRRANHFSIEEYEDMTDHRRVSSL